MQNPKPLVCSCRSTTFVESVKCSGWWKRTINGYGEVEDTDLSSLKYGPAPKTVTCWECGKRHPHPLGKRQPESQPAESKEEVRP
jgi:hypothetical protein